MINTSCLASTLIRSIIFAVTINILTLFIMLGFNSTNKIVPFCSDKKRATKKRSSLGMPLYIQREEQQRLINLCQFPGRVIMPALLI
jgi:hypothetical protein